MFFFVVGYENPPDRPQTHKGGGISTGGADFPEKQPKGPAFGRPPYFPCPPAKKKEHADR